MLEITQQLERVRRTSRRLLIAQVLLRFVAAVGAVLLVCGVVDYALRLPWGLRLVVGVGLAAGLLTWVVRRLMFVLGFHPDLSTLALRAERLYPQLAGALASGVEFAASPGSYADSPREAAMAQASVASVQRQLEGVSITRLINPSRTLQALALAAAAVLVLGGVAYAKPYHAGLAAKRWFLPLSGAEWPQRTRLDSLISESIWPSDTPLRLRARVSRNYSEGMRTWAWYRVTSPAGSTAWQSLLMNDQSIGDGRAGSVGDFERLIDLPPRSAGGDETSVEFYFEAGDATTIPQSVRLIDRPSIEVVRVEVEPPAYAAGLVQPQSVLLSGPMGTATALAGSRVTLRFELNKAIDESLDWSRVLPGFASQAGLSVTTDRAADKPFAIVASFTAEQTVQTAVHVTDAHGLSNLSEREYRIEVTADQAPSVSVTTPSMDESVLPTAVVPLEAVAQDDLAIETVALQMQHRMADSDPENLPTKPLRESTGRSNRLTASHDLDLGTLSPKVGDEVLITAVTRDVFDLDGKRHEPVVSTPRRLRVIDQATLIAQIRAELGGVRQQATRLEQAQREITDAPVQRAQPGQAEVSQRLETPANAVRTLRERMERNRLDDAALEGMLERSSALIERAREASRAAQQKLDRLKQDPNQEGGDFQKRRQESKANQDEVAAALTDLVSLLSQGQDTLALQMAVQQLIDQQNALSSDTRAELPRLLGKSPEELTADEKRRLEQISARQGALASRAEAVAREMQSTAEEMAKNQDPNAQATAAALAEAAAIAQRQGLTQDLQEAADAAKENKLSEAGQNQDAASQTMSQMLGQLAQQGQKQQEVLHRQLTDLADAVQKLLTQQKAQLERLGKATNLTDLEPAQSALRRNTLAVQEQAGNTQGANAAAKLLGDATEHQGKAVTELRAASLEPATEAEKLAIASLEAALAEVRKLQEQMQREQDRQTRERLRAEYERLAKEEDEIRKTSEPLAGSAQPTRKQRSDMIALGNRQADLRVDAQKLRDDVKKTLLFSHLHERIDKAANRATETLRGGKADRRVLADQASIASALRTMAKALEDAQRQEDFAKQESGGQGGQGGQGQPQPLVPPAAELKLLRELQADIYQQTRMLADTPPETPEAMEQAVLELSTQQRELSGLGRRLIESMKPRTPDAPGDAPPGSPEEQP